MKLQVFLSFRRSLPIAPGSERKGGKELRFGPDSSRDSLHGCVGVGAGLRTRACAEPKIEAAQGRRSHQARAFCCGGRVSPPQPPGERSAGKRD